MKLKILLGGSNQFVVLLGEVSLKSENRAHNHFNELFVLLQLDSVSYRESQRPKTSPRGHSA
jgi:hypothetical protein